MMKIVECLWKEQYIEKLERKHNVSDYESKRYYWAIHTLILLQKAMSQEKMSTGHWAKLKPDGI